MFKISFDSLTQSEDYPLSPSLNCLMVMLATSLADIDTCDSLSIIFFTSTDINESIPRSHSFVFGLIEDMSFNPRILQIESNKDVFELESLS